MEPLVNLAHLSSASADETAALLFITGDQYLFRSRRKDGALIYKFVSPAAVRAAFAEETIDSGWLPATLNVRRWGIGKEGEWILVAFPPQKHRLLFAQEKRDSPIALNVPLPALAFFGYARRYYVWAFQDDELQGHTPLFAAPLPNVHPDGGICFGQNVVAPASAQTISGVWQLFCDSPFNDHLVSDKSRRHAKDVRVQLMDLASQQRRRYPRADLVDCRRTMDMAINLILRGTSWI